MFCVGADVSKGRWLTIKLSEGGSWEVGMFHTINEIWDRYNAAKVILIDIPIGLNEGGSEERLCDKEARRVLGWPRRCSVFRVPCRATLRARSYEDAGKINQGKTGKGLSMQTWGIIPKIREVDEFLNDNIKARSKIREIHPEVCFWALNGGRPMEFTKKKGEGYHERFIVLCRIYDQAAEIINYAIEKYQGEIAPDDAIDALAAAVTALLGRRGISTIPDDPQSDSKGLPMEMVYYLVS